MSRSYYYFAASLPMINWGGKLPLTSDEFLLMAQRLLAHGDRELVERLLKGNDEDIETDNAVALSWFKFDRNFRNEIAWFRAHRAHKNPNQSVRGVKENEPSLRETVHEVSRTSNLLEAEKLLDWTYWQYLDNLSSGHHYDLEFIICYGLKLKILERHHEYKSPKGSEVFDGMKTMELPVDWAVENI